MPKQKRERLYLQKQISKPIVLIAIKKHAGENFGNPKCLRRSAYELLEIGAKYFMAQQEQVQNP